MPEFTLSTIDYVMISAYALVVIVVGLYFARREKNAEQYFLAGRRMTWPLIGVSLFASNISSTTLVGLSGNAYGQGIAVFNYEWMAAIVLVIIAAFFLPAFLRARVFTIPEYLERRFDRRSRYFFSALTLFLNIVVDTAGSLYAGGLVIQLVFPELPLWQIIAALGLVLAGLLAALMSSIDSTLNSASTLVTMDFVHTRAPGIDSRKLMWIGRGEPVQGIEALMWRAGKHREPAQAVPWYSDFRVLSLGLLALTALVVGAFA